MVQQDIDLCKIDSYADYLAELETRNPSIAQEDIYSDFGVLLVPKGTVVSPGIVLKLSDHRMHAPLDQLVGLETRLNSKSLLRCFQQLLEKEPELQTLVDVADFSSPLAHLCVSRDQPFTAMQKLTVIAYRLPDLFERTLGVTLLACLSAKKLNWDNARLQQLFEAALFRDIGLLHLMSSEELNKKLRYEQNHAQLQTHGHVSERILDLENRFPDEVLAAVRNHHERRDGAGFPHALSGESVSELALMISLMDDLWLRRESQAQWSSKKLANLTPLLRTNAFGVNSEPYRALLSWIMDAELTGDPLPDNVDLSAMSSFLLDRNLLISQLYTYLMQLAEELPDDMSTQTLGLLTNSNIELIRACGFANFETMALLTEKDPDARYSESELLELDLSQTEFFWRISKLIKLLEKQCSKDQPLHAHGAAGDILTEMRSIVAEADVRTYLEAAAEKNLKDDQAN
ncbi:MAG: hypothetical protein C9356_00025 [Oleiphilus sp.]|nr:MAG: hypothetical protein C9356_00025 [Oleiphilus sp.]